MQALRNLYEELIALYGYVVEAGLAFIKFRGWLCGRVATDPELDIRDTLKVGKGNPNRAGATYQYTTTPKQLIDAFVKEGPYFQLLRKSAIALAYAMWEDQYRGKIAQECGMADKNEIKSDVFQDLNTYRQAILHRSGKLGREPKVVRFFNKGDTVSFTVDHMEELFSSLIDELNRIGKTYYKEDLQFSFHKPVDQAGVTYYQRGPLDLA
ncbi:MAG: hypothetical protein OXC09_10870 [Truepera sp.]|nr:hypothetical protein [Truepera sp.]